MTKDQAIAIRFCTGAAIPIADAFAYADSYVGKRGYASPREVIWEDGSFSYAKGWWGNSEAGYSNRLIRIGAGAYGTMDILERDNVKI